MIRTGLILLIGSWIPLVAVGMMDPEANPIGLGLLAIGGSLVGMAVLAVGLLLVLFRGTR